LLITMKWRMGKWLFAFACLFGCMFLSASTIISDFHAKREGNTVVLGWTTESETRLARFDLERSTDRLRWFKIGEKAAMGESATRQQYTFRDNTIFKAAVNNFYYRLVLVDKNGQSAPFDVITSVSGTSGIRHTWGSIKAMFR